MMFRQHSAEKYHKEDTEAHYTQTAKKLKIKKKIFKEARGKSTLSIEKAKMKITFDFSSETMQARGCCEIFTVWRE